MEHAGYFVASPACPRQYVWVGSTKNEARALLALAKVVVHARKRAGMTQEEVAFEAGISVRHLQALESGAMNPSYLVLLGVSHALKVSISRLLGSADEL